MACIVTARARRLGLARANPFAQDPAATMARLAPLENPMQPRWSDHAAQRSAERLMGIDVDAAFASARPAGNRTRQRIRAQCPISARRHDTTRRYYLVAPGGVVFVMQPPGVVVTVFTLRPDARNRPFPSPRDQAAPSAAPNP